MKINFENERNKVIGWNINQRSGLGATIPELVVQELIDQDADIIVLTEVVKNNNLPSFIQKMHEVGYESAISKNENANEVCILWKTDVYHLLSVDDSLITTKENDNPNYLMAILENEEGKKLNVVGYRIRVGSENSNGEYQSRARQMKIVTEKLEALSGSTLVVTDSNNLRRGAKIKEWNLSVLDSMLSKIGFTRTTPDGSSIYAENALSRDYEFAEDHFITNGVTIVDSQYDRNFVKRNSEIYKWGRDFTRRIKGTNHYEQIRVGYPDHAIVKGSFEIV